MRLGNNKALGEMQRLGSTGSSSVRRAHSPNALDVSEPTSTNARGSHRIRKRPGMHSTAEVAVRYHVPPDWPDLCLPAIVGRGHVRSSNESPPAA